VHETFRTAAPRPVRSAVLFMRARLTMKKRGEITVRAALENVPAILDCVGQAARDAGFDDRSVHQIQVAVDEACANVIEHAYCGTSGGNMQVSCSHSKSGIVIRVRDWGFSFEPDRVPQPDVDAPLEQRHLGGLGLFLIGKLMDEVRYKFDPVQGNEVMMVKHLVVHTAHHGAP
jgi:anti-sigma regulatory factor (Ser/Thr protein kinase)